MLGARHQDAGSDAKQGEKDGFAGAEDGVANAVVPAGETVEPAFQAIWRDFDGATATGDLAWLAHGLNVTGYGNRHSGKLRSLRRLVRLMRVKYCCRTG